MAFDHDADTGKTGNGAGAAVTEEEIEEYLLDPIPCLSRNHSSRPDRHIEEPKASNSRLTTHKIALVDFEG